MLRALRSSPLVVAVTAFAYASPRLTLALAVVATALGLLQPAFVIATGVLVQAVATNAPMLPPLMLLGSIFAATRMLGPIRDELGQALWRRVDQSMGDRIMRAVTAQPVLQMVEDPRMQDLVTQAEGAVTGYSVGQAAQMLPMMYSQRLFGVRSLVIVARTYWWAALVLATAHVVGYQGARWHWNEVTTVILARTDRMRRSFYLRGLALSSSVAKETRVFGLAGWLVDRYRRASQAVLQDLWDKRREGWLLGVGLAVLLSVTEAITIWMVATDSLNGHVSLGTAVTVVQAVFAAGFLSIYQDPDWSVAQAAMSVEKVRQLELTAMASGVELPGARDPAGLPARAICFEDVSFAYPGSTRVIFRNFNLTIEAGASLAIIGGNGAGKTTLVKLLARLYEPDSGRITVDGIDLRELEPAAWHQRIAAVFQDFVQFELMAYDNVAFGAVRAFGFGFLLAQAAWNNAFLSALPADHVGVSAGVSEAAAQTGTLLGTALLGSLLLEYGEADFVRQLTSLGLSSAQIESATAAVNVALRAGLPFGNPADGVGVPASVLDTTLLALYHQSYTVGLAVALLWSGLVCFGIAAAVWLVVRR